MGAAQGRPQTPAASGRVEAGKAAMMVNGPWNFSGLVQAHMYYGKQFGIRPDPDPCGRAAGDRVPGGEDWTLGNRARSWLPAARAGLSGADCALPFSRNAPAWTT
jgi:hypothetical protein